MLKQQGHRQTQTRIKGPTVFGWVGPNLPFYELGQQEQGSRREQIRCGAGAFYVDKIVSCFDASAMLMEFSARFRD